MEVVDLFSEEDIYIFVAQECSQYILPDRKVQA